MQNFRLTLFDFSSGFCDLDFFATFFVLRDLNFAHNRIHKQLNTSGGSSLLIVKWKVRGNWCIFFQFKF